jgi:hypothetical protein
MGFTNEFISEEDNKKYGISEINKKTNKANIGCDWTIDRERNIYLRWMTYDREMSGRNDFTFYWKGTLFNIALKRDGDGVRGGKGWTTWSIWKFFGKNYLQLPVELESHREEIIADLKAALIIFKDFGMRSSIADHTANFEF